MTIEQIINPIPNVNEQRRIKVLPLKVNLLVNLLRNDGSYLIRFEGWPDVDYSKAKVLNVGMNPQNSDLLLFIYHPDFPFVLEGPQGAQPSLINLRYTKIAVQLTEQQETAEE